MAVVARLALAAALACCAAPGSAFAQISPGPLADPHSQLEGSLRCVNCHGAGRGEQMSGRCLACHKEIAWLVERGRGLHADVKEQRCATCHPDHAGRDFALVSWPGGARDRFDHGRAGWPLLGAHRRAKCTDCHKPALRVSHAAALAERRGPDQSWVGLEQACVTCHTDPHTGALGRTCDDCHETTKWATIDPAKFNHDRTEYPLRGRHRAVACEKCHSFAAGRLASNPAFAQCGDCHRDAHAGTAALAGKAVDCASCHVVADWAPATYTAAQHRQTKYPLEGKHVQVGCADCHVKNPAGVPARLLGSAGVWMRPAADACRDCHADDHGGQLATRADQGKCESCHRVGGWTPSTFSVSAHRPLRLPLEGRHAEIQCRACHGPNRRSLPPLPAVAVIGRAGVAVTLKETQCAACHVDPHEERYPRCEQCHDARAFRPATLDVAAHARYRFPLEGAHAAVSCVECHTRMRQPRASSTLVLASWPKAPVVFGAPAGGCAGCHENPHGSQFAKRRDRGACESCHGVEQFAPATRFDHDRHATFALTGAHKDVPCGRCHSSSPGPNGARVALYRPVSAKCEACHGENVRRGS
jgi:hypothetical protein